MLQFRSRLSQLRRDHQGIAAVEFAFVSLMFIMLIVGSIEIVIMMQGNSVMQAGTSQTARMVMTNPNTSTADAVTYAQAQVRRSGYTTANITFTATKAACPNTVTPSVVTQCMTITGTYVHTFKLGFFGRKTLTLTDKALSPLIT